MLLRVVGTSNSQGPYQISSVPEARKYILCDMNKRPVNGGDVVDEKDLVLHDPFATSS